MVMEIICVDCKHIIKCEKMAACIGYFDGMHVGHQKLVETTIQASKAKGIKSGCITFEPDPWCVLKNMTNIPHITSMREREEIGEKAGLDYWIIFSFTKELANLPTNEFENLLKDLNVQTLICGFDFTYGEKGKGNVQTLKKQHDFDVIQVDAVTFDGEKISSTRIEKEIQNGNMPLVSSLLGRNYVLSGHVVNGNNLGHTYGFPTANLKLHYNSILPKKGVYIGYADVMGKRYRAMMNVGHNPTFNYQENISIEAYLVDFDGVLYEEEMKLEFVEFIRDEKKFASKDELINQLKCDVKKAKALE